MIFQCIASRLARLDTGVQSMPFLICAQTGMISEAFQ